MNVLLLNASPHREASHGYRLAREAVDVLCYRETAAGREFLLIERDLMAAPLPPVGSAYAKAVTSRDADSAAFALSETLIGEIEATDCLLINTPMHNFTVPAALKLWIDYVLRINRTFRSTPEGKVGLMRDRPSFVIVGSGGVHSGPNARQADFLTPYLRYALGSIGLHDLRFFLLQGLVMGDAVVQAELARERAALRRCVPFCAAPPAEAARPASLGEATDA
ncbi:FMN-dependent NADH-azoreductase [Burkholderia gladioli]|uniref:FMN-dependent NADH-azoreductase n=1 Tax=Burkholderia gladioli TaxID=28095 RepID=UPI00163EBDA4|nr:NAD(P)H-dependent oxidoreductase [Burkholderia gladioli]